MESSVSNHIDRVAAGHKFKNFPSCGKKQHKYRCRYIKLFNFQVVPPARSLCNMWEASTIEDSSPLQLSYSKDEIIADFLLALAHLDPSLLDNPRRLCKALVQDMSSRDSTVQSAVLQTISLLDPTYLTPDSVRAFMHFVRFNLQAYLLVMRS